MLPSPIDIITVGQLQSWLASPNMTPAEQNQAQLCITAASRYWGWKTGMIDESTMPTESPFLKAVTYDELYDGNDSDRLFLRKRPIQTVNKLTINGHAIQASTAYGMSGWLIDGTQKSLSLRAGGSDTWFGSRYGMRFIEGRSNIGVNYDAGFPVISILNEAQTISSTHIVTTTERSINDIRIRYASTLVTFTKVLTTPNAGEYLVQAPGKYLFNLADQNTAILIDYNKPGTPEDVQLAVMQMVALNYKRRQWIDQSSQAMAQGAGTISFREWELPPEVRSVLDAYSPMAVV